MHDGHRLTGELAALRARGAPVGLAGCMIDATGPNPRAVDFAFAHRALHDVCAQPGLPNAYLGDGNGMRGMRERAGLIGASLKIGRPRDGLGTEVRLEVPRAGAP